MSNLNDYPIGSPQYEAAYRDWRASQDRLNRLLEADRRQYVEDQKEALRTGQSTLDIWLRRRQAEMDRKQVDALVRGPEARVLMPGEENADPVTPQFLASRAETKDWVAPEVKVSQPDGQPFAVLTGYLSTFGPPADSAGDIVQRGAFAKSIAAKRDKTIKFPLLASHKLEVPIGGILECHEDVHGLRIRALIDLDTVAGKEAYSGIRKGYLTGLSMGYRTDRHHWEGNTRHLDEVTLLEGSVVSLPANERALVLHADLVNE